MPAKIKNNIDTIIINNIDRKILVLGIDPALAKTGLGIIEFAPNYTPKHISHYVLETKNTMSTEQRLHSIFTQMQTILQKYTIDYIIIEEVFVGVNRNTIIKLSMARSIFLLLSAMHNIAVSHIPTRLIKQKITGHGNATKEEIADVMREKLNITLKQQDCLDALACALYYPFLFYKNPQEFN